MPASVVFPDQITSAPHKVPGNDTSGKPAPVLSFALASALVWTAAMGASGAYNYITADRQAVAAATLQARTTAQTDSLYLNWIHAQKGVFTYESGQIGPNPYLREDIRTIALPDGERLVRLNANYLSRMVHDQNPRDNGILSRLTSSNPIRLANAPDPWETEVLRLIEKQTARDVVDVVPIRGKNHLRFMTALGGQPACLECHMGTPGATAPVIGALSVAVPMDLYEPDTRMTRNIVLATHGGLWFLGLFGIFAGSRAIRAYVADRDIAVSELRATTRELALRNVEIERHRRELSAFVSNVDAGVFLKDRKGTYFVANQRMCDIFGQPLDTVLGSTNSGILPPAIARRLSRHEALVRASGKAGDIEVVLDYRGTRAIYSFVVFPIQEGDETMGLGGLVVDVTEREQAARTMRDAKNAAEQANAAKTNFLANMSHEIRTPLNGLIGMSDLLLRTRLSTDQASMAEAIKSCGISLLGIINDILDISKIVSGKLTLETIPFSPREVLYEAVRGLAPVAYKKKLELVLHIARTVPERIAGDPTRLRQLVLNLAANALKFTDEGEVLISVHPVENAPETPNVVTLRFTVSDTGIGIPDDKRDKIFRAFEQVDNSTTRKYGGTGLGLAICAQILDSLGSTLELESTVGCGSRFWFDITADLPDAGAGNAPDESGGRLRGMTVLLVENNTTSRGVLEEMMEAWGIRVITASTVSDALEQARKQVAGPGRKALDAIVCIQFLEDGSVLDVLEGLRADPDLTSVPVIKLAAGSILECPEPPDSGVSDILEKPVSPNRLVDALVFARGWSRPGPAAETGSPRPDEPGSDFSAPRGPASGTETAPPIRVLLVEDVEMNQIVAGRMLEKLGCETIVADHGAEAIELLRSRGPFDLILMDIQMPVLDGISATRRIRAMEAAGVLERTLIVAITANAFEEDQDLYIEAGMDAWLTKPVLFDDLKAFLETRVRAAGPAGASPSETEPSAPGICASDAPPSPDGADENGENGVIDDNAPLIEPEIMARNFEGNAAFIEKSVELYLRDGPALLREIGLAIARGDNESLRINAHALKGITGFFNRSRLIAACLALEKAGRENELPENRVEVETGLAHLETLFERMKGEMAELLERLRSGSMGPGAPPEGPS